MVVPFRSYAGPPEELAYFSVGDTTFVVITVPRAGLNDEAEIFPTFNTDRILIVLSRERVEEVLPEDMPDMARGMALGMLMGACVALAERWLENRGAANEL